MTQIKLLSYRVILKTGEVLADLEITLPTGVTNSTVPVSEQYLQGSALTRGAETWDETDIAAIVATVAMDMASNVIVDRPE